MLAAGLGHASVSSCVVRRRFWWFQARHFENPRPNCPPAGQNSHFFLPEKTSGAVNIRHRNIQWHGHMHVTIVSKRDFPRKIACVSFEPFIPQPEDGFFRKIFADEDELRDRLAG